MKNIIHTKKILLKFFVFIIFFMFVVPISSAQITKQKESEPIFKSSQETAIGYVDKSENPTTNTRTINKVKVCKDVSCTNYGIIDFEVSGKFPLVIDTKNGLSGKVYGNELGWITFNPPYGGVFFANPITGLLKGTAWSETSGAINFSVTGQKVVIDPNTGEWNGWAWASGPYGGWIKFDCKDASCVKTTWRGQNNITPKNISKKIFPTPSQKIKKSKDKNIIQISNTQIATNNILRSFFYTFINLYKGTIKTVEQKSKIFSNDFNIFISIPAVFFSKTGQIINNIYNSTASYIINFRDSVVK